MRKVPDRAAQHYVLHRNDRRLRPVNDRLNCRIGVHRLDRHLERLDRAEQHLLLALGIHQADFPQRPAEIVGLHHRHAVHFACDQLVRVSAHQRIDPRHRRRQHCGVPAHLPGSILF